jgi:hypothetical protein
MKVSGLSTLLLALGSRAQNAVSTTDGADVGWTEVGTDGSKDSATGQYITQSTPEYNGAIIQTAAEQAEEQGDITEFRKKFEGIYDPNMYPYGPLHGDYRVPDPDDAVSDPINLPSPFPFFDGQSTSIFRASTNGIIALGDHSILSSDPEVLPSIDVDAPFVAGFWNDIWAKKHGRIYWRLEMFNTTLLAEMKKDAELGYPELAGSIGTIQYAFIVSYWRCTYFGASRNGDQNTFQMTLFTDGVYSFFVANYQLLEWTKAVGHDDAMGGYDDNNGNYAEVMYSHTPAMLNLPAESTNAAIGGRHVWRLDAIPPTPVNPTTQAPTDTAIGTSLWPANDNTLGGGIFEFTPSTDLGNGTCSITFPNDVAWFHIFDAHVRVDSAVTSTTWKVVAANDAFEPGEDGSFQFIVFFNDGEEFTDLDVNIACDATDEFTYAVYSFPQNHLQADGRTNLRRVDTVWEEAGQYTVSLGQQVANFTVDDPRITASTIDNQNFVLTGIPETLEEIWFQFEYDGSYFGSNEVGVNGP